MCSVELLKLRHLLEQDKRLIEEKIRQNSRFAGVGRILEMRIDQYYLWYYIDTREFYVNKSSNIEFLREYTIWFFNLASKLNLQPGGPKTLTYFLSWFNL